MSVKTTHPEYLAKSALWKMVRDACRGDYAIKEGEQTYLPAEFAKAYPDRYAEYKQRAIFMGVTGRTLDSLVGMIFRKPAASKFPTALESLIEDIDGSGQSLEQISKQAAADMLQTGRYAFLVDSQEAPEGLDSEQERALGLRPTISAYAAEAVKNWKTGTINGRKILTLVTLEEQRLKDDQDEFGHDEETIYRVLRLTDGVYTQQLYNSKDEPLTDLIAPRTKGGKTLDHIPLHFAGSQNNLPDVDQPPLYDLAVMNIGHYRNTANVEESGYLITQPFVHIDIGDTTPEFWQKENPNGVEMGSRRGITTVKGSVSVVQAAATDYNLTLMDRKEAQMVMLGARLVQRGGQAETAEAARINASAEASTLDTLVSNLSEALEAALEDMALFLGEPESSVEFKLNSNFWESNLDPMTLQSVIAARQAGIIGSTDALYMIRKGAIELNQERTDEQILGDAASESFANDDFTV